MESSSLPDSVSAWSIGPPSGASSPATSPTNSQISSPSSSVSHDNDVTSSSVLRRRGKETSTKPTKQTNNVSEVKNSITAPTSQANLFSQLLYPLYFLLSPILTEDYTKKAASRLAKENKKGLDSGSLPFFLELQLLIAVILREYVFSFMHSFLNKFLGITAKYFIVQWVMSGRIPLLYSLQKFFDFGPTTIYFTLFTIFSYLFSCLKTGTIVNPTVAMGFLASKKLRNRHFILVVLVEIVANFSAMFALSQLVSSEYQSSFDPPMFPDSVSLFAATMTEMIQAIIFVFWTQVSANLSWSFEKKTFSNVLVRQSCYVGGYNISRSCGNPAVAIGSSLFVWAMGWRDISMFVPYCIAYSVGPLLGSFLGAKAFIVLRSILKLRPTSKSDSKSASQSKSKVQASVKSKNGQKNESNNIAAASSDLTSSQKIRSIYQCFEYVQQLAIQGAENCNLQENISLKSGAVSPPRTSLNFLSAFPANLPQEPKVLDLDFDPVFTKTQSKNRKNRKTK